MGRWAKRSAAGARGGLGDESDLAEAPTREARSERRPRRLRPLRAEPLVDSSPAVAADEPESIWTAEPDPVEAAALRERYRARAARDEALRELKRLRDRHWSGERLIEEGRKPEQWWEHPDADPYAVLGLLPGAAIDEASSARRRIALTCHPDRLAEEADPDLALRRMVAANAAYDRLRRALHPV